MVELLNRLLNSSASVLASGSHEGPATPRSRVLARLTSLAQIGELARGLCEPNRLRTITIMKTVRFSYSLLVSYYVFIRKVIN